MGRCKTLYNIININLTDHLKKKRNFDEILCVGCCSQSHYNVVPHRLGSGTGSGCKYRELVSEVRQGAVLNLFLPRMRRIVRLPVARWLHW